MYKGIYLLSSLKKNIFSLNVKKWEQYFIHSSVTLLTGIDAE
jgi:hypothetical protein